MHVLTGTSTGVRDATGRGSRKLPNRLKTLAEARACAVQKLSPGLPPPIESRQRNAPHPRVDETSPSQATGDFLGARDTLDTLLGLILIVWFEFSRFFLFTNGPSGYI